MNNDFAAYIDNLKKQIKSFDVNLIITEKKLQYGIQLTVTNSDSKVVLSVSFPVKTASSWDLNSEAVPPQTNLIPFYGIVPILKVLGQVVTNQVKEISSDL